MKLEGIPDIPTKINVEHCHHNNGVNFSLELTDHTTENVIKIVNTVVFGTYVIVVAKVASQLAAEIVYRGLWKVK